MRTTFSHTYFVQSSHGTTQPMRSGEAGENHRKGGIWMDDEECSQDKEQ